MVDKDLDCSDHQPFITVKSEDGTERTYYSILYEDLPEEILRKARKEVNETEKSKTEGMAKLKEYIKKEKLPDISDEFIIAILRCCKYDIKKSKAKLAKFVKIFETTMNKMSKLDMDKVAALISEKAFGILPYRDREGRIITIGRSFLQMSSYDAELLDACFVAAVCYILILPMASLLGVSLVAECKVPEMRCFYPLMRVLIHTTPQVMNLPHRFAAINIVNEHFLGRFLYKSLRPFMPEKINKRVSFVGTGYGELHKDYPPEIMPEELGGYLGSMHAKVYKQKMLHRLKYELEKLKLS